MMRAALSLFRVRSTNHPAMMVLGAFLVAMMPTHAQAGPATDPATGTRAPQTLTPPSPPFGFRDVDPADPIAVYAARNVVALITFGNPGHEPPEVVPTQTLPQLDLSRLTFPVPPQDRAAVQGAMCRANGLAQCPVFREEMRGAAFSLGQPGHFLSCRHAVQDWIYWAWHHNRDRIAFDSVVPPLFLADRRGRLLYTSLMPGGMGLRKTHFVRTAKLQRSLEDLLDVSLFWDADFIGFALPKPIRVEPFGLIAPPRSGQAVHLFGYPPIAVDAAGAGETLLQSSGRIGEVDALSFSTSAASTDGMSGSPVLSDTGAVVGMTCSTRRRSPNSGRRYAVGMPLDWPTLSARLREKHGVTITADPP